MNIYADTTQRILDKLEQGVIPWRKTWATGLPVSLATGREYRGINIMILSAVAHDSRHWVTFREALRLGGHVRKGEKATTIIHWHWRTPEELDRLRRESGKTDLAPCVPFTSPVFNLAQVEGVAHPDEAHRAAAGRRLDLADQLFAMMPDKPGIVHSLSHEPSYHPTADRVGLPHLSQFESADEYYSTLFHELVHATGHPRRLNRFAESGGDESGARPFEELVAEFGAAFLCGFAGIRNEDSEALTVSYIHGWSQALRHDPRLLLRAASAAQRAADYIRGKVTTGAMSEAGESAPGAGETTKAA